MRLAVRQALSRTRLLYDEFERANTSDGDLGIAPTGQAWSLRAPYAGVYPLPASSFGKISSGAFVVTTGDTVYGTTKISRKPKTVTCDFSWVDLGSGTQFTVLAIGITNSPNHVDTMLHITLTNGTCTIQKRINGGSFDTMNSVTAISPSLALGNARHQVRIDLKGTTARVRIDGTAFDQIVSDADIPNIVGPHLFFEHFSNTTDVRWPLTIHGDSALG